MKYSITSILSLAALTTAQITIPATNGSLPAAGSNGCAEGYSPGRNVVTYTLPYALPQVLTVIGNFTNLTWAGSPPNSVSTNASASTVATNDWKAGDARFYNLVGAYLIETLLFYTKTNTVYSEAHTLAPLTVALPSGNVSFYSDYDYQKWEATCDGKATFVNFTIPFCATDVAAANTIVQGAHLSSAQTVGMFLGGMNFTSCAALGSGMGMNGTMTMGGNGSSSAMPSIAVSTGGATGLQAWSGMAVSAGLLAGLVALV